MSTFPYPLPGKSRKSIHLFLCPPDTEQIEKATITAANRKYQEVVLQLAFWVKWGIVPSTFGIVTSPTVQGVTRSGEPNSNCQRPLAATMEKILRQRLRVKSTAWTLHRRIAVSKNGHYERHEVNWKTSPAFFRISLNSGHSERMRRIFPPSFWPVCNKSQHRRDRPLTKKNQTIRRWSGFWLPLLDLNQRHTD